MDAQPPRVKEGPDVTNWAPNGHCTATHSQTAAAEACKSGFSWRLYLPSLSLDWEWGEGCGLYNSSMRNIEALVCVCVCV